ncbi:hypothetical protein [Mucilaginibacter jinjuensis]|uniref:Uncharacterized protein n=1 Tax=Mucilaginibacter jinjuensis TaxID=1176721 RepID=A0ABY7T5I5_9SPHI|nr:hypothetical protein [Mucilaginibacter jinjuensis]WCT11076.1 hypothetical protein PQO05_20260 [Mucilaginibacter jinjuensis]
MRTSLNELKQIEDHLLRLSPPDDTLLFAAKMILDTNLRSNVLLQQRTYTLVQQYGRKQLKAEIEAVHQQIFSNTAHQTFVDKILSLFKK